jgi:hypothetical protein
MSKKQTVIVSRFFNRITGGTPGVTFSAQSMMRALHGEWSITRAFGRVCVIIIDWWTGDPKHCETAYNLEMNRRESK